MDYKTLIFEMLDKADDRHPQHFPCALLHPLVILRRIDIRRDQHDHERLDELRRLQRDDLRTDRDIDPGVGSALFDRKERQDEQDRHRDDDHLAQPVKPVEFKYLCRKEHRDIPGDHEQPLFHGSGDDDHIVGRSLSHIDVHDHHGAKQHQHKHGEMQDLVRSFRHAQDTGQLPFFPLLLRHGPPPLQ